MTLSKSRSHTDGFNWNRTICLASAILISACASLPDAQVLYYPAKTEVTATLDIHITCDEAFEKIFHSARLTPMEEHSANLNQSAFALNLKDFGGALSDGNIRVNHYPDGRLNSINATSTGRGQQNLSSAVSLAGSLFGINLLGGTGANTFSGESQPVTPPLSAVKVLCGLINPDPDKSKTNVMTLKYTAKFDSSMEESEFSFSPDEATSINLVKFAQKTNKNLVTELKLIRAASDNTQSMNCLIKYKKTNSYECLSDDSLNEVDRNTTLVRVQGSQSFHLTVSGQINSELFSNLALAGGAEQARNDFKVPKTEIVMASNDFYYVPFQSKPVFGVNMSALSLTPMGSVSSITYNSTSGGSAGLDSIRSILDEFQTPTSAERATEIAQDQRLLRCIANPEACV